MMFRRIIGMRIAVVAGFLGFAICHNPAFAQSIVQVTPQETAAANVLFQEGKTLHDAENFAEAIPKFEGVLKVVYKVNTALRLADCYEKTGRLASAYGLFKDALSRLSADDENRRLEVTERAKALEPRLPYATVRVPKEMEAIPTFSVALGDRQINRAFWPKFPIDPGEHIFKATADGFEPREVKQTFVEKEKITIEIPSLVPNSTGASRQKTVAYAVGAVGLVGLGVGAVFGGLTISQWDDAHKLCPTKMQCDDDAVELSKSANTSATLSNVAFGVGAAAVVTGIILLVTAPKKTQPTTGNSIQFVPVFDRNNAGATLSLRF